MISAPLQQAASLAPSSDRRLDTGPTYSCDPFKENSIVQGIKMSTAGAAADMRNNKTLIAYRTQYSRRPPV
jgi:hypothetical protein